MKVLRVVDKEGKGLYQGSLYKLLGLEKYGEHIPYYQPCLLDEGINMFKKSMEGWLCAFKDYSQFYSWMRDVEPLDIFINEGKVLELEVSEMKDARAQVVFNPLTIKTVREIHLDEFINNLSVYEERYKNFY